jgi:hypothetical protein
MTPIRPMLYTRFESGKTIPGTRSYHNFSPLSEVACVAGPQFYGGPDLQRTGFWRARGRIEGLQESLPFMTTQRIFFGRKF